MKIYIRRKNSDTWHYIRECHHYPDFSQDDWNPEKQESGWHGAEEEINPKNYVIRSRKPSYGELCNECQAKERNEKLMKKARKK